MAIKAGQIIHDVNGTVVDRIQTGGVSNLNIPEEKIYELGNYNTVATVRDIADLSFSMESLDVSTEIEALLLGQDPTATMDGDEFDFADALPLDVISPFKGSGVFTVVKGIAIPYLTLESVSYRFGVKQNAGQTVQLKGDSIYYVPGTPKIQSFTLVNNTLSYNFTDTAIAYVESGDTLYALGVCVKNPSTGAYKRLFFGEHYTNTSAGVTLLDDWFDSGYTKLHVVYGTTTVGTYDATVHQGTSVKPAAVRAKDIDVYVYDPGLATPALTRWTGVQSFEVTRSVNLEADEEFGNSHYVSQDYDTADVTGSISLKPTDAADFWSKIAQIASVSTTAIVGPYSAVSLAMELRINDPDTGDRIKTLYVPDARFTIPAVQGQVQQKLTSTLNFTSDGGNLKVYAAERP